MVDWSIYLKSPLDKKIALGFAVSLLMVVVLGAIAFRNTQRLIETSRTVSQTYEVLGELEATLATINQVETGQRGYIITGEEVYLEPYQAALARVDQHIKRIEELMADNPDQQQRMARLKVPVSERLKLAIETVDARRNEGFEAAQEIVLSGRGRDEMDLIRQTLAEMENEEKQLLQSRSQKAEERASATMFTLLGLTLLIASLLTSVLFLVRRDLAERWRTGAVLHAAHAEMEEQVERRTSELANANTQLRVEMAERERAAKAQHESEERYHTLIDISPDAIMLTDLNGTVLLSNERTAALFGYSNVEEVIGENSLEFMAPEERSRATQETQKLLASGDISGVEYAMCRKDGGIFPAEVSSAVVVDTHGRPTGFMNVLRDITHRKQTEERVKRQLDRLRALRNIDLAITASLDLRLTLNVFLDQVISQLQVDAANVLLFNQHSRTLDYAASRGFRFNGITRSRVRMGEGYSGRAALERRTISIPNIAEATGPLPRLSLLEGEEFVSCYFTPLIAKGEVKGVLEVMHRRLLQPEEEWVEFLEALAGQAAIAVDSAWLFDDLQRSNLDLTLAYDTTLEGWSRALDLRDKETEGHTQRVTEIILDLARTMGLSDAELVNVRRGALLHDIGKMGIPDAILLKPGPLTDEEWEIMRKHPVYAYELLSPISFLRPALDIPYCHHEKWDGTGYPRGLKGEQIPLAARIFAVVDVWDALRSDRPYRQAWSEDKVREHIQAEAGKHFDPKVVDAFLKMGLNTEPTTESPTVAGQTTSAA